VKIYLAARYSRHPEMRGVRDVLETFGHEITSRWIDQHGGNVLESFVADKLNTDPEHCAKYGRVDVEDMTAADVIISFTTSDGGGKGGRHVEFGWGLAAGKRMILVGPREHIFHTLPGVEWYPDWPRFVFGWRQQGLLPDARGVTSLIDAAVGQS
jgi:hypothetical protein